MLLQWSHVVAVSDSGWCGWVSDPLATLFSADRRRSAGRTVCKNEDVKWWWQRFKALCSSERLFNDHSSRLNMQPVACFPCRQKFVLELWLLELWWCTHEMSLPSPPGGFRQFIFILIKPQNGFIVYTDWQKKCLGWSLFSKLDSSALLFYPPEHLKTNA